MSNTEIDIQIDSIHEDIPTEEDLLQWTKAALEQEEADITLRIVDEEESAHLNSVYRNKQGPTNVLSFLLTSPHQASMVSGDIIICAPIVSKEAKDQKKSIYAHWAHLTVHGILHLQGFDHIKEDEAKIMEAKEIKILSTLGIPNPYMSCA
jgi:probable rRNA maturation factor